MCRVTAGDGYAGSSSWRARIEKLLDDPSPGVTRVANFANTRAPDFRVGVREFRATVS
jgi:hypothetical protein